jgi:high-affinity iron transporter
MKGSWTGFILGAAAMTAAAASSVPPVPDHLDAQRAVVDRLMLDLAAERPVADAEGIAEPWLQVSPLMDRAQALGRTRAAANHDAMLQTLAALDAGRIEEAQQWRSRIDLPRYANAVEGAVALARVGKNRDQTGELGRLLAREYIQWQTTRIRQKSDDLLRALNQGRLNAPLAAARASELQALASFPSQLLERAALETGARAAEPVDSAAFRHLLAGGAGTEGWAAAWREELLAGLPNLLGPEDVERNQRLMAKLLKLVPMEYKGGVRDGEIAIPIEYREAVTFTQQASQIFDELRVPWRKDKAAALEQYGPAVEEKLGRLEAAIARKLPQAEIDREVDGLLKLLQDQFGVGLRRMGKSGDVVAESALEIRSLLGQSLGEAREGRWRKAEELRLEAYTTFDIEIERRVLPRDPELAVQAEQMFLDGGARHSGIKSSLDARKSPAELEQVYQSTLASMDECVAVLKVGLAPKTVGFTSFTIVLREGLEAVVILAALLAGFRGVEQAHTRRRLVMGAWLAIAASVITFIVGNTIIQGLSRYGEVLEAVVSILAVIILLMVTNWVFHKVYWVEWNTRLRELSRKAKASEGGMWEALSMVGVGFLTIYREGFETTLFMQSLILEGGWLPSVAGALCGLILISALGYAVFIFGAKLPYRKLLVVTGVLVVSIMVTFIGSTVRLFQIVGWLSVHPIEGLQLPAWTGIWLGLYPTWEGLLIPPLGLAYVSGAWFYSKWKAARMAGQKEVLEVREPAPSLERAA